MQNFYMITLKILQQTCNRWNVLPVIFREVLTTSVLLMHSNNKPKFYQNVHRFSGFMFKYKGVGFQAKQKNLERHKEITSYLVK